MGGMQARDARVLIRWLKEGPVGAIPITHDEQSRGALVAATWEDAGDRAAVERLGRWHQSAFAVFGVPARVTAVGARQWLVEQVLEAPERVLFWVRDASGRVVGHVGLARFDFTARTVALRDVVCGEPAGQALMGAAVGALRAWVREAFGMWTEEAGAALVAA
jgi:hypothetical protein